MELRKGMTKEQIIAAWGKPAYVKRYSSRTEEWFFGCGWPHSCETPDEDTNFPLVDEIFNSWAIFTDGKLSEWTSWAPLSPLRQLNLVAVGIFNKGNHIRIASSDLMRLVRKLDASAF